MHLGASWSFALNAISFLMLVVAPLVIKRQPPVKSKNETVVESVKAGLRFVRGRLDVATMLLLVSLTALHGAPVVSMLPALVKSILRREASSYSELLSCFGGGDVVAALISALHSRRGPLPWLAFPGLIVLGICQIALGFGGSYVWVALTVALAGLVFVGTMIRLGTAILKATPDEFRGRVTSLQQICFRASQPLDALLAGLVARHFGIRIAFWSIGGLLMVSMLVMLLTGVTTLRSAQLR